MLRIVQVFLWPLRILLSYIIMSTAVFIRLDKIENISKSILEDINSKLYILILLLTHKFRFKGGNYQQTQFLIYIAFTITTYKL